MFGLTKRQFLKRSKECLKETGIQILSLRELINKETNKKIGNRDAHRRLDIIRRDIEGTFSRYEKLNPPSPCVSLQHKILNSLIALHEAVVTNSESLTAAEEGFKEESGNKLNKSVEELQEFQGIFLPLSREVDLYLRKK